MKKGWFGRIVRNLIPGGPKEISREAMEKKIDAFQDQYDVPESELGEVLRNKDKRKWRK